MLNLFFSCKPYRASILFFFSSCILLSCPFWDLKNGIHVSALIIHLWLVWFIIFKKKFFKFNSVFKGIAINSKSFEEFNDGVNTLVSNAEYQKLCFWLEIAIIWSFLSIIQWSMQ